MEILGWFIFILFVLLSLLLLAGKGSFLIAGYNTASEKEKARYDKKKLCRVTGAGFSCITLLLGVNLYYDGDLPFGMAWITPLGIILSILFIIIASNTICRCKEIPTAAPDAASEKESGKKGVIRSLVITGVVGIAVLVLLVTGSVKCVMEKDSLDIQVTYWADTSIPYETMESVEYTDDLNVGARTSGLGNFKVRAGRFNNHKFGAYRLYSYTKCKEYVIIHTKEEVVAVNLETPQETKALYQKLLGKIG